MITRGASLVLASTLALAAPAAAEPAVGVLAGPGNTLVTFDTAAPGTYTSVRAITGLQAGEQLAGIDYRYSGTVHKLYGLGVVDGGATDALTLYTIDPGTGAAATVGSAAFTGGDVYGMAFNPTADRIRVVNDADHNGRLNPDTGALVATDTALNPAGRDVTAIAYDRMDTDPATATTQYGLSEALSSLVTVGGINGTPSPNSGVVNTIGPLGFTAAGDLAFDISPGGAAFASAGSRLYGVSLANGSATLAGATPAPLRGLALVPVASVSFAAPTFTASESAGAATISLVRGGALDDTVAVDYAAGDATGRLTFAPGETAKTFTVPVANDAVRTPDRVIALTLRPADALAAAGPAATLTIADNDAAADTTAPKTKISAPPSTTRASLTKKGIKAKITPNEAAKLEVTLEGTPRTAVLSAAYGLTLASKTLALAAGTRSATLKPPAKLVGHPKRSFKVRIKVVATDAAGNRSTATRTVTVKR